MEIAGSLRENLDAAVRSARRLRARPVYGDTLDFWRNLLLLARATKRWEPIDDMMKIESLVAELEEELSLRQSAQGSSPSAGDRRSRSRAS